MTRTRLAVVAAVLAVLLVVAGWTARPALAAPPDCTACHKDDAADAKAKFPLAEYRAGVHGAVECALCHRRPEGSFDKVPHAKTEPDLVGCISCHGLEKKALKEEYKRGVHGTMPCNECHDAHTTTAVKPTTETAVRSARANGPCIRCHQDAALPDGPKAHQWLPNRESHAKMRCVACHAKFEASFDHEIVPKAGATRDCEACHKSDGRLVQKYVGTDDRSTWVTNPVLFEKAYVPGATRHRLVDRVILGLFVLTVLGALGHGLLRVAAKARRPAVPYDVVSSDIYPLGMRIWHWTNAALMLALAITGLRIHFGGRERPILTFEEAFNIHNVLGVLLIPVTIFFFVRNAVTGDQRQYLGKPQDGLRGVLRQALYYGQGIFRGDDHPYHASRERRFNPLQQMTYAGLMYTAVPVVALSGIVLLFPQIVPERIGDRPGAWWIATIHYLSGVGMVAFLLGHLYLATTGDGLWYLVSAMFTGRHRHHVRKGAHGDEHGHGGGDKGNESGGGPSGASPSPPDRPTT